MKSGKDKLSRIEVIGRLLTKEIKGTNIVTLTEESKACVLNLSSEKTYHYCLYFTNQDKNENSNWEHLSFDINPSMNLSFFNYEDVDCLQWFTKTNIYFLEILLDDFNEINKNNFWKVLEQCLCSTINKIPIERASLLTKKSSTKYMKYIGVLKYLMIYINIV